ncbi:hypothetical protein C3B79_1774 [Aeromonas hydrophila]|nr:hypothetical protein C3B79_1774 [Aeromonas hydrophila]
MILHGDQHATGTTGQQRSNHGCDRHLYQFHSSYLHNPVAVTRRNKTAPIRGQ